MQHVSCLVRTAYCLLVILTTDYVAENAMLSIILFNLHTITICTWLNLVDIEKNMRFCQDDISEIL